MNTTKLTLKLDGAVIQHTKRYAQEHHLTLSGMVENYFRTLLGSRRSPLQATPLVRELSGIAPPKNASRWKEGYADHLLTKYASRE